MAMLKSALNLISKAVLFSICISNNLFGEIFCDDSNYCYEDSSRLGSLPFPFEGDATLAFDHFRSLPDGSWDGNTGAFASVNLAAGLPNCSCYGLGTEFGASYGIYDWAGRGASTTGNLREVQRQTFVTLGLFRSTPHCSGLNVGFVYDWMFNEKLGVYAMNPTFAQFRFSSSFLWNCDNEFGFWGTTHTETSRGEFSGIPVRFRAINQINLFWRHFYSNGGETAIWAGLPYGRSLLQPTGPAGNFIVGARFNVPLTGQWSVVGHAFYMQGKKTPRDEVVFPHYASNVCIGINYAFGGPTHFVDNGLRPFLRVADNSTFVADTSSAF